MRKPYALFNINLETCTHLESSSFFLIYQPFTISHRDLELLVQTKTALCVTAFNRFQLPNNFPLNFMFCFGFSDPIYMLPIL